MGYGNNIAWVNFTFSLFSGNGKKRESAPPQAPPAHVPASPPQQPPAAGESSGNNPLQFRKRFFRKLRINAPQAAVIIE